MRHQPSMAFPATKYIELRHRKNELIVAACARVSSTQSSRNIRQQAKRRRVPLNALADFAQVSRSQLYYVLARSAATSTDWLEGITKVLDIEPGKLLLSDTFSKR